MLRNMGMIFILFFSLYLHANINEDVDMLMKKNNMQLKDISFNRDWVEDTVFRFPIITKTLNNPLFFINRLDSVSDDIITSPSFYTNSENLYPIPLNLAIDSLIILTKKLKTFYNKEELKYLAMEASAFWEQDTTNPLKGKFFFDRGIQIDTTKEIQDTILYEYLSRIPPVIYNEIYLLLTVISDSLSKININDLNLPSQYIKIGNKGNDTYTTYPLILIEPEGNDVYINPATTFLDDTLPFHIIIDKSGNDTYRGTVALSVCASFLGANAIYDMKGNDLYEGKDYSISSSLMGVSIIKDYEGEDVYKGYISSVASATFGISVIYDYSDNDIYSCYTTGEGFGGPLGIGILLDKNGDDTYRSGIKYKHEPLLPKDNIALSQGFGMGWRPDVSGGIGILIDSDGNDFYNTGVFGQGSSYWYAIGMLIDKNGQDFYSGAEYCQGAGIHLSVGILEDLSGDDAYYVRLGPSQGEGHDLSVGYMNDKQGDDFYYTSGGQGIGLTNSVGIFIDDAGDDYYAVKERAKTFGQGITTETRGFRGIGLFLDREGKDVYVNPLKKDSLFQNDKYVSGIFYDFPLDTPDTEKILKDTIPDEELNMPIDSLFIQASLWEVGNARESVKRARKAMHERWKESWNYIVENKMDTKETLELRAINNLIKKNKKEALKDIDTLVYSKDKNIQLNAIYFAGMLKDTTLIEKLSLVLKDKPHNEDDERIRRAILNAIYEISLQNTDTLIIPYLLPEYSIKTRIFAAKTLTKTLKESNINLMLPYLFDESSAIRFAIQRVLLKYPNRAVKKLLKLYGLKETNKKEKNRIKETLLYIRNNAKKMKLYLIIEIDKLMKNEE